MKQILSIVLCLILIASRAEAQQPDLALGIRAYTEADYRQAITVLEGVDESQLRPDERVVLHKFLALSLIARRQQERAQEELINLLTIEPGHELSEQEFPPAVLELFQKAKIAQGSRLCDRGVEAYNAGQFREAVANLEQSLQLNPRDIRASEFLKLAANRLQENEESQASEPKMECAPSRAWAELNAKDATCQGIDYSSSLKLPVQANRVTLIYSKHYFGVGKCWKIVLYDAEGNELLVLDDPAQAFASKDSPDDETRWRVIDLPETRTVARVVMHGEGGHAFDRFMGQRVGKDRADEFILGLEVTCPLADNPESAWEAPSGSGSTSAVLASEVP